MEDLLPIIIQAVSGLAGGNAVGTALKKQSLGKAGNSIVGLIGGVLGGLIISYFSKKGIDVSSIIGSLTNSGADASSTIGNVAGGGIGGGILMVIAGLMKNKVKSKK